MNYFYMTWYLLIHKIKNIKALAPGLPKTQVPATGTRLDQETRATGDPSAASDKSATPAAAPAADQGGPQASEPDQAQGRTEAQGPDAPRDQREAEPDYSIKCGGCGKVITEAELYGSSELVSSGTAYGDSYQDTADGYECMDCGYKERF